MSVPWTLMANADVDEELVYDLISVVHKNQEALGASFGLFNSANFDAMAPQNAMPYHPGAVRYYEEIGMTVEQ